MLENFKVFHPLCIKKCGVLQVYHLFSLGWQWKCLQYSAKIGVIQKDMLKNELKQDKRRRIILKFSEIQSVFLLICFLIMPHDLEILIDLLWQFFVRGNKEKLLFCLLTSSNWSLQALILLPIKINNKTSLFCSGLRNIPQIPNWFL